MCDANSISYGLGHLVGFRTYFSPKGKQSETKTCAPSITFSQKLTSFCHSTVTNMQIDIAIPICIHGVKYTNAEFDKLGECGCLSGDDSSSETISTCCATKTKNTPRKYILHDEPLAVSVHNAKSMFMPVYMILTLGLMYILLLIVGNGVSLETEMSIKSNDNKVYLKLDMKR